MLKRNIKLFTAILAVLLVADVSIFYACKKTDDIPLVNNNGTLEYPEKDYNVHIKELIATTGIDIYEFHHLDKVKKISSKSLNMMKAMTETSNSKGEFSEAKLEQLQNLKTAIDIAKAAGNENEVLSLFESYCAICMTIDGFIFSTNEYGMQTFIFNGMPITYPGTYIDKEIVSAEELIEQITNNYSIFPELPEETQIEIIAAAIYLNLQNSGAKEFLTGEQCRHAAWQDYGINCGIISAKLNVSLFICSVTGPGVGICVASAFADYGLSMGVAYWMYKRAVKRC